MRVGGAASAPPHPSVRGFADAGMTTPAAPRNIPAAQGHVPVHRLSEEQGLTAERNDLDGRGMAQGQLLAHHPGRVADGRNQAQHHADDRGTTASDSEMPTTRTPPNDTAIPAASRRGNPSCSSQSPSSARRIGPMLTSIAAVPASTSRSPQLSVTKYSPNQSSPEPRITGQAARVGQPPPLSSHTTPRASEATSRRPSASAPGAKCPPALRIATKAEAHSTTVTAAAPTARESSLTPPG